MINTFPEYHCDPSKIDYTIDKIINIYNYPIVDKCGNKTWLNKEGRRHREDGPAFINYSGDQFYYKNGDKHRLDGPAVMYADGSEFYYQNDELHRTDGPALIIFNGTQKYYQNGKLHRDNGPAVILSDGTKEYWVDGHLFSPCCEKNIGDACNPTKDVIVYESDDF